MPRARAINSRRTSPRYEKVTDNGRNLRTEKNHGLGFTVVTLSTNDLAGIYSRRTPVTEIGKEPKPESGGHLFYAI